MKYYRIKNLIGLCAMPGCHRFIKTCFLVINKNKKRQVLCTCLECSLDIYETQNVI